ncbi:MAG: hypothetical protein H6739_19010 [Alphaproteobacteria bacterium]|nr:hypothetical protein [Alphaproteobacteria bacterium]
MRHLTFGLPALLFIASCGRPATEADIKMAGVGLNPDEIGPAPTSYGGYVEYDWVNFAGGGLTLSALGLVSYDAIGPGMVGFQPPYAAIYGLAFVFDTKVPAPDAHHGSIGVPPAAADTCWTNYEPFSFLMSSTVELGDKFEFVDAEGDTYFGLGRVPEIYPPNPEDIFVYYSQIESWLPQAQTHYAPDGSGSLTEQVLRPANFTHGESVSFRFAGGIPPLEAPVSSIPRSSASVGVDQPLALPSQTQSLRISWNGPAYDGKGALVGEGAFSTCVQFIGDALEYGSLTDEELAAYCAELQPPPDEEDFPGQIYTGPWDTSASGDVPEGVKFEWAPGSADTEETVSLNVRFLAPVDQTNDNFLVGRVPVTATASVQQSWDLDSSRGLVEGNLPQGYRSTLACDDDASNSAPVEWIFDPTLLRSNGDPILSMQGDPTSNLVEVSCRLEDDGEFLLTNEHLADALAYANRKNAGGAIFYFSRSTDLEAEVPAVRDQEGYKREITPIIIRSHSVDIGRFWLGPDALGGG